MLGYEEKELIGTNYFDYIYHLDREESFKSKALLLDGKLRVRRIEKRFIKKDGSIFWGSISPSVLYDKNKKTEGIVVIILDITETKNMQEELKKAEEKYRNIFENAPVGIFQTLFLQSFIS